MFDIEGAKDVCDIVKVYGGKRYENNVIIINDQPMNLATACKGYGDGLQAAGWKPPYAYTLDKTTRLAAKVRAGAGPQ